MNVNKPINLVQLDDEMGNPGLSSRTVEGVTVEVWGPDDLDEAALAAAVDAHLAVFPPPPPSVDELLERIATLEAALGNS